VRCELFNSMMPFKRDGKEGYWHPCWMCKQKGFFIVTYEIIDGNYVADNKTTKPCLDCNGEKWVTGRKGVPYAR
jgi:hypothetical protein